MNKKGSGVVYRICPLCLSMDRSLHLLGGTLMDLSVALGIFTKAGPNRAVCWECHATIREIARFKATALRAQAALRNQRSRYRLKTSETKVVTVGANKKRKKAKLLAPCLLPPKQPLLRSLLSRTPLSSSALQSSSYKSPSPPLPSSSLEWPPSPLPSLSLISPSSTPPSQPTSLPPLPSSSIGIKLTEDDVPKLDKFAPKPVYIFVEKPKNTEVLASSNSERTPVLTKRNTEPNKARKSLVDVSMSKVVEMPKETSEAQNKLGSVTTRDNDEMLCKESMNMTDSEDKVQSDDANDTALYLSYDTSETESCDSFYESVTESDELHNEKTLNSFEKASTNKITVNDVLDCGTAYEEENQNLTTVTSTDDAVITTDKNITNQKNSAYPTIRVYSIPNDKTYNEFSFSEYAKKQKSYNEVTINHSSSCTYDADYVQSQDRSNELLTDIIDTTKHIMNKPSKVVSSINIRKLGLPNLRHKQQNAKFKSNTKKSKNRIPSSVIANERNISVTETNDIGRKNNPYTIIQCDDNIRNNNNPQIITQPKITADGLWNKKLTKPFQNTQLRKQICEKKQKFNLDTLIDSSIVLHDHLYTKDIRRRLLNICLKISKEGNKATSYPKKMDSNVASPPPPLLYKSTIDVAEMNDLHANESFIDDNLITSSLRSYSDEHLNASPINMTDVSRNDNNILVTKGITSKNVNVPVSVGMKEIFRELPISDEDVISDNIKIEYDGEENYENFDFVDQCALEHEEIDLKTEFMDCNELTNSAADTEYNLKNKQQNLFNTAEVSDKTNCDTPSFDEPSASEINSSDLILKDLKQEIDKEGDEVTEESVDNLNINIPHSNLTTEPTEEQVNMTSVSKSTGDSEELKNKENNLSVVVQGESKQMDSTENDLLKPLFFTNCVDDTFSYESVASKPKQKSHKRKRAKNKNRLRMRSILRKITVPEKRYTRKTQNEINKKYTEDCTRSLLRKRIRNDSHIRAPKIEEKVSNIESLFHLVEESEAKLNPNNKRNKINSDDVKAANMEDINNSYPNKKRKKNNSDDIREPTVEENIKDNKVIKYSPSLTEIVISDSNINFIPSDRDNVQSTDKITATDFIDNNNEITSNMFEDSSDEEIILSKLSKKMKELSNKTNLNNKNCNSTKKPVKKNKSNEDSSFKIMNKNSQEIKQINVPAEIGMSKLMLNPVVKLEKIELDLHSKLKTEPNQSEIEAKSPETVRSDTYKITPTDFIENNKEITLDELGEFSGDELAFNTNNNNANTRPVTERPHHKDTDEETVSEMNNYYKFVSSLCIRVKIDIDEIERLRKVLRRDSFFNNAPYKCVMCMVVFRKRKELDNHTKLHTRFQRKSDVACGICTVRYQLNVVLKKHIKSKHKRCFKCRFCPNKYVSRVVLTQHVSRVHPQDYEELYIKHSYGCVKCDRRYHDRKSLMHHLNTRHTTP